MSRPSNTTMSVTSRPIDTPKVNFDAIAAVVVITFAVISFVNIGMSLGKKRPAEDNTFEILFTILTGISSAFVVWRLLV